MDIVEQIDSRIEKVITRSSLSPANVFSDFQVRYPKVVTDALCLLYDEYNEAFHPLVETNREWSTDYRFVSTDRDFVNSIVQIDMCGLDQNLISKLENMQVTEVLEILRKRIFEMENSWALYQILRSVHEKDGERSFYGKQTEVMLDTLRKQYNMPIALLAVTQEKYDAMKASEFGKEINDSLSSDEVRILSGFDRFFGPKEFAEYLVSTNYECEYLLYVRASDPIEKLKRPEIKVEHPILLDPKLRKIIKEYSITPNIDNPEWPQTDIRRINDTKWYLPVMSMGFAINTIDDLNSTDFLDYLSICGIKLQNVSTGEIMLRAKPIQGTFGCYGHVRGFVTEGKFRKKITRELKERGPYLVQIEQEAPLFCNINENKEYAYIDRVFCGKINGKTEWMGGHRECLPFDSHEVKSGRLHGNEQTVSIEIV